MIATHQLGDRVQEAATGSIGVVMDVVDAPWLDVSFREGRRSVHADDLVALPPDPHRRLAAGDLGDPAAYLLRLQAAYLKHAYRYDPLAGLSAARIEPQLHQVFVAHRVVNKLLPRMILADEVGLGKTIEAGLILKELRARKIVDRVLIICPASLQQQWQQELRSKFNEEFDIFDRAAVSYHGRGDTNPWTKRESIITSLSFATRQPHFDNITATSWDLVIFDEAHRVRRWRPSANRINTTLAYQLADELKEHSPGLLLLTATPMQLHAFELYSLIDLVEPGLYHSYEDYDRYRRTLPQLNELMKALRNWPALPSRERTRIFNRNRERLTAAGLTADHAAALDDDAERDTILTRLANFHPLAEVLVRNRKAEIGGFTPREPSTVLVELATVEAELYADISSYICDGYNRAVQEANLAVGFLMVMYQKLLASSSYALRTSLNKRVTHLDSLLEDVQQRRPTPGQRRYNEADLDELRQGEEPAAAVDALEQAYIDEEALTWEITTLRALIERLGRTRDSKAGALLELVERIDVEEPAIKILVFTQFISTQHFLAYLLERNGFEVAIFNGTMPLPEKEAAVRHFRTSAQILVTTEAGGEGRNFQFAHTMVNYDLPWNPMKVEQRIGRLDRIGQTHPVRIYNLACHNTVEERVLEVLRDRIELFEESVGSLDPILGNVERDLERLILEHPSDPAAAITDYGSDLAARVAAARLLEHTMGDLALDRASFRRDQATELLGQTPLARFRDLQQHITSSAAHYGGSVDSHPDGGQSIALSQRLAERLRTRTLVHRGVFDPAVALRLEDLDFFSFGHNLIDGLVELPLSDDHAVTGSRHSVEFDGGPFVEIFYEIEGVGLRAQGQFIHHLVGPDLIVHAHPVISVPGTGTPTTLPVPTWTALAVHASWRHFQTELQQARAEYQRLGSEEASFLNQRLERIHLYRRDRLERLVVRDRAWIEDMEVSGTAAQKRILPAIAGRLRKREEELAALESERAAQTTNLAQRAFIAVGHVVAAGLVVGT